MPRTALQSSSGSQAVVATWYPWLLPRRVLCCQEKGVVDCCRETSGRLWLLFWSLGSSSISNTRCKADRGKMRKRRKAGKLWRPPPVQVFALYSLWLVSSYSSSALYCITCLAYQSDSLPSLVAEVTADLQGLSEFTSLQDTWTVAILRNAAHLVSCGLGFRATLRKLSKCIKLTGMIHLGSDEYLRCNLIDHVKTIFLVNFKEVLQISHYTHRINGNWFP